MKLLINADDLGLTRSGSETILNCIDEGLLNGVSIVPNGAAFDYAVTRLADRRAVSLGIHLNLVEGRPVSPPERLPRLVDSRGCFRYGFIGLWKALSLSSGKVREDLLGELRGEIVAQIQKCVEAAAYCHSFRLDSHTHVHMIPPIFEIILQLVPQYEITYIRIPHERFINHRLFSLNGIKQVLLRLLSRQAEKKIEDRHILHGREFFGILYSGRMHQTNWPAMLERFGDQPGIAEVLFHPGGATPSEITSGDIRFGNFYLKTARLKEARALRHMMQFIKRDELIWQLPRE